MGNFVAGMVFLAFVLLCWLAWPYHPQRSAFNQFVDKQEADYHPKDVGVMWNSKKAAQMAEVWNLTPQDVSKPVNIFKDK